MGEKLDPMLGRMLHGTILIRRKIGAGGMGNVYEGYQEHLDRVVAVKVLTPEHARNPIAAEYFLREARAASALRHPNIIQIIDYGTEEDGTLFLAMEYVPGQPLSRILRKEFPLSTPRIIELLDQTLAGLVEAHRKELVHRDLKPDNLMVETIDQRDFVKILDFGIAQSRAAERQVGPLTRQGAVVGTPHYMSPEQAAGDPIDVRSDLFSLGVILYEILSGELPFGGESLPEVLVAVIRHNPQPPSAIRPDLDIDPRLEAICLRALKKERDFRYQSAQEFRDALRGIEAAPVAVAEQAPAQFVFRSNKRRLTPTSTERDSGARRPATLEPASPSSAVDSPPSREVVPTWPRKPSRPGKGSLGFDVEELRGDLLGERMQVVAVVVHQRSARRIDAEELLELRKMLDTALDEITSQWHAVVQGRQGSFTTILFGVPHPGADDELRAAQATLQLRHRLSKIAPAGTAFSFAVSCGEIFCAGGALASAAGQPIDDASEAARDAADGTIVVTSDELAIEIESMFRLTTLGVDGHRALLGVRDASSVIEERTTKTTDLVGRDQEIATSLALLGRLSQGKGAILPIIGEPGVGKSAVLEELTRMAETRGFRVVKARARWSGPELLRWIRLRWLTDLLRQHGRRTADAEVAFREMGGSLEYARLLAAFLQDRLDRSFGFVGGARSADVDANADDALRLALRQLTRALTAERPLVLAIDELDGFDGAFAEDLRSWVALVAEIPLLIVCSVRLTPGRALEDLPTNANPIYLQPLDDDSARAFLRVRLQGKRDPKLIDRLVRIGAGFPLHLEHLARQAAGRADMTDEEVQSWLASSRDINEILRQRLFEQDRPTQNVLALLAALGDGASGETLLDLASADWAPEKALASLYENGLLVIEGESDDPRLFFRPPAFRHVIYENLSRKARARIHARAAAYYKERVRTSRNEPHHEDLVALAQHLERSGDPSGALETLNTLIDHTLRRFEFDIARTHLREAIRVLRVAEPENVESLAHLELQLISTDVATGRRSEAIDRCRRLDRAANLSPRTASEVRIQLAQLWLEDEDPDLVEKIAGAALADVRKLHTASPEDLELRLLLIRALQTMASCQEGAGRLVKAAAFALEAADLIESSGIEAGDNPYGPALVWETLNQLGRIRLRNADTNGARKMFDLALRIVTEAGDQRGELAVRANLASLLASQGQLDLAQQAMITALRLARNLSDPRSIARLEHNRGLLLMRQKRANAAREAFSASLELSEELDWRAGIAMNVDQLRVLSTDFRERQETGDRFSRTHKD